MRSLSCLANFISNSAGNHVWRRRSPVVICSTCCGENKRGWLKGGLTSHRPFTKPMSSTVRNPRSLWKESPRLHRPVDSSSARMPPSEPQWASVPRNLWQPAADDRVQLKTSPSFPRRGEPKRGEDLRGRPLLAVARLSQRALVSTQMCGTDLPTLAPLSPEYWRA